jgi:hypothetical protein
MHIRGARSVCAGPYMTRATLDGLLGVDSEARAVCVRLVLLADASTFR